MPSERSTPLAPFPVGRNDGERTSEPGESFLSVPRTRPWTEARLSPAGGGVARPAGCVSGPASGLLGGGGRAGGESMGLCDLSGQRAPISAECLAWFVLSTSWRAS